MSVTTMPGQQIAGPNFDLLDFLYRYKMGNQQMGLQQQQFDWQKKQDAERNPLANAVLLADEKARLAQALLYGAQIEGKNIENRFAPEVTQAGLGLTKTQTDEAGAARDYHRSMTGKVAMDVGQSLAEAAPETPSNIINAFATNYDRIAQGGASELPYFNQNQMIAAKQRGAPAMGAEKAFVAQETAKAQAANREPSRYTLAPGDIQVDERGRQIASAPPKEGVKKPLEIVDIDRIRNTIWAPVQGQFKGLAGKPNSSVWQGARRPIWIEDVQKASNAVYEAVITGKIPLEKYTILENKLASAAMEDMGKPKGVKKEDMSLFKAIQMVENELSPSMDTSGEQIKTQIIFLREQFMKETDPARKEAIKQQAFELGKRAKLMGIQ